MQRQLSSGGQYPAVSPGTSFTVHYADRAALRALLSDPTAATLGIVGYGARRPTFLPPLCPFVAAPISPAAGEPMFEIWRSDAPTRHCQVGEVTGASNDELVFGALKLDEAADVAFEDTVEQSYLKIFDFLDETGFSIPIRFWNYLTAITAEERGLERYRRFNIGRHRAFSARLREPVPPAASGVGGDQGDSVIYFLAARTAARPIQNPRQINAYEYPPIYGPSSPRFSRASVFCANGTRTMFVSGTASIVGHETLHVGNFGGQIKEALENLRALIRVAEQEDNWHHDDKWALKVYLHDTSYRAKVDAALHMMFGTQREILYLRGDICRPELMVEIEALRQTITK